MAFARHPAEQGGGGREHGHPASLKPWVLKGWGQPLILRMIQPRDSSGATDSFGTTPRSLAATVTTLTAPYFSPQASLRLIRQGWFVRLAALRVRAIAVSQVAPEGVSW